MEGDMLDIADWENLADVSIDHLSRSPLTRYLQMQTGGDSVISENEAQPFTSGTYYLQIVLLS